MLNKSLNFINDKLFNNTPLIRVFISSEAILNNYNVFKNRHKMLVAPVLKSNAYGHGLPEVAKILKNEQVPFFVVDSLYEARLLRKSGINDLTLVIGFAPMEHINSGFKNIAYTIGSLNQLKEISKGLKNKRVFHLKIDTGMRRQGILPEEISETIKIINQNPKIELEGICSHFADADGEDFDFTNNQIELWNQVVEQFKKEFRNLKYFHIAATSGSAYSEKIDANLVRLGIGLYGFDLTNQNLRLKPALKMVSFVSFVKKLDAGHKVGYNLTYEARKETKIAVVPVGYFEGVDRRLSNSGSFCISGKYCPIVGRVCMNMTMLDVSQVGNIVVNDEVEVFSDKSGSKNSIEQVAKLCKTNPHEILVHIPQHLRRIIV